jgi:hypothetical protein
MGRAARQTASLMLLTVLTGAGAFAQGPATDLSGTWAP